MEEDILDRRIIRPEIVNASKNFQVQLLYVVIKLLK